MYSYHDRIKVSTYVCLDRTKYMHIVSFIGLFCERDL